MNRFLKMTSLAALCALLAVPAGAGAARGDFDLSASGLKMCIRDRPYTPHELENAMHDYELPPIHYTVIRANLQQMGVGGDDSWGARTHDEHLIDVKKPLSFTFSFKGI